MKNVLYKVHSQVAEITLNRPQALNALNSATLQELKGLLHEIAEDQNIRVVIITGAGEKAFVAGADISQMQGLSALEGRKFGKLGQQTFALIEKMPQIVIAAVNGFALGGGCELAMACDIRLASPKAKFGQPEVSLGIIPGFSGTQRLPRLVGKGLAKELICVGEMIDAEEAYRIGLVNKIYEAEELLNKAREMAGKIISRGPVAVALAKSAIENGMNMDLTSAIDYEGEVFGLCFATAEQKEGMTAFLEKRKPNF
ncbi:MAG: enoyl-CoA hydratase-related protein [Peptococcaceae bacterium]